MESISSRRRKGTFSIEYIEEMFDKKSYPLSRKPKRKIVIGGETIRYYNPNYHMFFKKGYSCVKCGLTGQYYALESSGGDGKSFSLCLYAKDKNNSEVLMVGAKIDPNLEKTTKHYYDIQPMCQRCNNARDKLLTATDRANMKAIFEKAEIDIDYKSLGHVRTVNKTVVNLFDGVKAKSDKVLAFCHNPTHPGWVNKRLMEKHKCIEKRCSYMQKANLGYWVEKERKKVKAALIRTEKKENAEQNKKREEYIRSVFEPYEDVYVTSIRDENNCLKIAYIYDNYFDLSDAIEKVRKKYKLPIYMKAVKSNPYITQTLIRDRKRTDLLKIPGVGAVTKERLNRLGYYYMEDLIGQCPERIFEEDCD